MMNKRMSWIWMILLFLGLVFYNLSASQARHISSHHPTAVVVGTVFCDVCQQQQDLSKASHFISGAIVAVECGKSDKNTRFYQQVKTNVHGEFRVHLPFKHVIGCSARLISSSEPHCAMPSTTAASSSSFRLQSRKKGTHIFSAGLFSFKPVNQPKLCNQKTNIHSTNNKEEAYKSSLTSTTPNDPILTPSVSRFITINQGFLPPLPGLPPLPQLPPLPPLVVFPPFFRAPLPMSPPFFHSPPIFRSPLMSPPSILPPVIPPPTFDLIPLSPPPPPPSQFPLPPFPFHPMPGFPGVPTSSPDNKKHKHSP